MADINIRSTNERQTRSYDVYSMRQRTEGAIDGIYTNAPSDTVVWAYGKNVHFDDQGVVYKKNGAERIVQMADGNPVRGLYSFYGVDGVYYTIVCTLRKIYACSDDFNTVTDITGTTAPSGTTTPPYNDTWTFALCGGQLVISNGINEPWIWKATNQTYAATVTDLSTESVGGVAPALTKFVATHNGRVVMGNITDTDSNAYTGRIRWSAPNDPLNWTLDNTGNSGFIDILNPIDGMDALEEIVGFVSPYVFTRRNVYRLNEAEHPFTFVVSEPTTETKPITGRACIRFNRSIYYMGAEDFYFLGTNERGIRVTEGIGFPIWNACFPNLNNNALDTCFVYGDYNKDEVHFCVPTGSATVPNTEFIYNTMFKTWSIADCEIQSYALGYVQNITTWDNNNLPFGDWASGTDTQWQNLSDAGLLPYGLGGTSDGYVVKMEEIENNADGSAITAFLESGDITLENPLQDKHVRFVYPFFKPQVNNEAIQIQVGVRDRLDQTISWSAPQSYIIGVDTKIPVRQRGKYVKIRFYSNEVDTSWALIGYDILLYRGGYKA